MCFRPAEISMKNCPQCGKVNKPVATVCEDCGAELDNTVKDFDADQASLDSAIKQPGSPTSPQAVPSAPKSPRPRKAPGH